MSLAEVDAGGTMRCVSSWDRTPREYANLIRYLKVPSTTPGGCLEREASAEASDSHSTHAMSGSTSD
eukprot:2306402-Rhodomonas_salina.2